MIKEQAERTPEGQWVRVIGGWTPYQFVERRMPTIAELNKDAPKVSWPGHLLLILNLNEQQIKDER